MVSSNFFLSYIILSSFLLPKLSIVFFYWLYMLLFLRTIRCCAYFRSHFLIYFTSCFLLRKKCKYLSLSLFLKNLELNFHNLFHHRLFFSNLFFFISFYIFGLSFFKPKRLLVRSGMEECFKILLSTHWVTIFLSHYLLDGVIRLLRHVCLEIGLKHSFTDVCLII